MTNRTDCPEERRTGPLGVLTSPIARAAAVVAVASFVVAAFVGAGGQPQTTANAAPNPGGDLAAASDEADVASGSHSGKPWMLRAYRAAGRAGTPLDNEEALCLRWKYGERQPLSNGCNIGGESLDPGEFFSASNHVALDATGFFGTVDKSVASLELVTNQGTQPVEVYPSPRGLRLSFNFFVGFAPAGADATLVARSEDGTVVREQEWPAMPRLIASVEGSGSGTVTGSHDCETTVCKPLPERERIIDCGEDCWADLHDAEVVELRAEPAVGSRFTGWSGGCEGLGECVVTVDSNMHVTAHFEELP